mmetsp:Transcript_26709/g.73486  ORF Transcript_26709/g.73486 Transcript_26709/m.73486 type:complete len:113 (-) Transcript_26709:903-1241(-)
MLNYCLEELLHLGESESESETGHRVRLRQKFTVTVPNTKQVTLVYYYLYRAAPFILFLYFLKDRGHLLLALPANVLVKGVHFPVLLHVERVDGFVGLSFRCCHGCLELGLVR